MADNTAKPETTTQAKSLVSRFHGLVYAMVIAITAAGFYRIPETFAFPAHWGAHGVPDWLWPRDIALAVGPLAALLVIAAFAVPSRLMPKSHLEMIRHNAEPALTAILGLFCAVQLGLVLTGAGSDIDLIRILAFVVAAALLVLGVVIGEAERHTYAGVRLPWPIESDRLWRRSHRVAGWLWIAGAVILGLAAWLQPAIGTLILALPVVLATPLIVAAAISARRR